MKKEKIQNKNEDSGFIYTYNKVESREREIRTLIYMLPWTWPINGNTHTLPLVGTI
jgi:hypothetical protein